MSELQIDIVSDVVCPWCFIGKRRLEAALGELRAARPDIAPRIRWLPYFLNPDTPQEGEPYRPFLERKFGGPEKLAQIQAHIAEAGRTAGIEFAFERIEIRANTLRAHRLIHRAQKTGSADVIVERLFAAHFLQGENIGDEEFLARLAGECGGDEAAALAYLHSEEDAEEVRAQAERGQRMGITGVPFFIFNGRYGVGGAQPPEVLLDAMRQSLDAGVAVFIGHFGIGFGAEAAALRVSLGTLFLAAESPCCAGLGQVVLGHWLLVLRAFWVDSHRSSRTAAWRG